MSVASVNFSAGRPAREPAFASRSQTVTANTTVLVVEDEVDLAELICLKLKAEGYRCSAVGSGLEALHSIERWAPDLIILDRMLPGLSGDEFLGRLRHNPRTSAIPVIMLTAKAEESDELIGFSLGADDYLSKPCSMKVLAARVAALIRRATAAATNPDVYTLGPITVDAGRHEVTVNGAPIVLTATEFRLLTALAAARGRVLARSQLIDKALGEDVAVTDRTIDVHITSLRKKLNHADETESAARWIQTIRGVGYSLRAPAND